MRNVLGRLTGSVIAASLAFGAVAQDSASIRLQFGSEGEREVWVGSLDRPGEVSGSQVVSGVSAILPVTTRPNRAMVFVHDRSTGNVAERPLADVLKTGTWRVGIRDEKRVYRMDFVVEHDGKPVASAVVRARAGGETREALVSPSDEGKASVFNLKAGRVEVTVQYKTGEQTKSTPAQTFDAKLGLGPTAARKLVISEKVETVAPTAGSGPATESTPGSARPEGSRPETAPPPPAAAPNPLGTLLNLVVGLAVVGGVGYAIYRYVAKNPQQVQDALKQVGLGDQGQAGASDPAPVPQAPQPVKPIVLDPAGAPELSPGPLASPVAGAVAAVKNPRLVGADGSVALLLEGVATVGREAGLEVSLVGQDTVSRRHAQAERAGDSVTLTDLGSTNGTFVNGVRLTSPVVLQPGDAVQFGSVAFRFEV